MGVDLKDLSPNAQRQVLQKLAEIGQDRTGAGFGYVGGKHTAEAENGRVGSKYGNRKVVVDGIQFDSKREARRYLYLKALETAGQIQNLQLQVEFELIPNQYASYERYGKKGQRLKDGKRLVEKKCSYVADFVYEQNGKTVVEDSKGHRTKDYILKRKMMLFFHGIKIMEV